MVKVALARVDDRLIHGQVMTAWVQYTGAKHIIIVDDGTANDEFTKTVISMAVPKTIKLDIFTIEQAVEFMASTQDTQEVILLAKFPDVFYQLKERGWDINSVIIGGMGTNKDRSKLYKNVAASESEREILKKMIEQGVDVKIQIIPDQKAVGIKDLL